MPVQLDEIVCSFARNFIDQRLEPKRNIAPRNVNMTGGTKPKEIGEMACGRISPF